VRAAPEPEHRDTEAKPPDGREDELHAVRREVDRIAKLVERMNLGDYIGLLQRPGRLLWVNFLAGLARGLGTILGATLLVSLIVAFMQKIIASNLPGVSHFLQDFLRLLRQTGSGH
jgi:hypothetical protein